MKQANESMYNPSSRKTWAIKIAFKGVQMLDLDKSIIRNMFKTLKDTIV